MFLQILSNPKNKADYYGTSEKAVKSQGMQNALK